MKKYASVLGLSVRSSIYKICLILLGMTALQLGSFYRVLKQVMEGTYRNGQYFIGFEAALSDIRIGAVFGLSLFGVMLVLVWTFSERGKGKTKYLLKRLRVGRGRIFALQSAYCVLCLWMVMALQVILVVVMYRMYVHFLAGDRVPQALLLAFYRDSFLHGILPLSDVFRTVKLIGLLALWGISAVYLGQSGVFSKYHIGLGFLTYLVIFSMIVMCVGVELLWLEILLLIAASIALMIVIYDVVDKLGKDDENEM